MLDPYEEGFGGEGPNLNEIECTNCRNRGFFEWKNKKIMCPAATGCEKYKEKPDGILFPICKDLDDPGVYIKCKHFEPIEK